MPVEILAKSLYNGRSLCEIHFCIFWTIYLGKGHNSIGENEIKLLAKSIETDYEEQGRFLNFLDLRWNKIGNEGAKFLAESLSKNYSVKFLDLSIFSV